MDGERSEDGSAPVQKHAVTLWDLLTLLAFSGSLGGTIAAAQASHLSGLAFGLVIVWGVMLGIGCVVCVRTGGERLLERTSSETLLPFVYLANGLWIVVSAVISFVITSGLVHLLQ